MTDVADTIKTTAARAVPAQRRVRRKVEEQVNSEVRAYAGAEQLPLPGYAALLAVYGTTAAAMAALLWRKRRILARRFTPGDIALLSVATFKLSRLATRDSVTSVVRSPLTRYEGPAKTPSEVNESPRGGGVRKALGELATCPYCFGQWAASAFVAGHLLAPRATRVMAATLTVAATSDALQLGYSAATKATS